MYRANGDGSVEIMLAMRQGAIYPDKWIADAVEPITINPFLRNQSSPQ